MQEEFNTEAIKLAKLIVGQCSGITSITIHISAKSLGWSADVHPKETPLKDAAFMKEETP